MFKYSKYIKNKKFVFFKNNNRILYFIFLLLAIGLFSFLILFTDATYGFNVINNVYWKQLLVMFCGSMCLGISTYLLQEMTNNKLADTSILGIGNINLIVAIFLVLSFNVADYQQSKNFLTNNSWIFTITSTLVVFFLFIISNNNKAFSSRKMVFIGIILNFFLIGLYYGLMHFVPANKKDYIEDYFNGSIVIASDVQFYISYFLLFICIIWVYLLKNKMFILYTDPTIAKTLGIKPNYINFQVMTIIGVLSGVSFFLMGNVVLLGLIGASISGIIFKRRYSYTLISSGLMSTIIMFISFYFNNNVLSELYSRFSNLALYWFPIFGVPYFIYLAIRQNRN